jgi:hypothetical protein
VTEEHIIDSKDTLQGFVQYLQNATTLCDILSTDPTYHPETLSVLGRKRNEYFLNLLKKTISHSDLTHTLDANNPSMRGRTLFLRLLANYDDPALIQEEIMAITKKIDGLSVLNHNSADHLLETLAELFKKHKDLGYTMEDQVKTLYLQKALKKGGNDWKVFIISLTPTLNSLADGVSKYNRLATEIKRPDYNEQFLTIKANKLEAEAAKIKKEKGDKHRRDNKAATKKEKERRNGEGNGYTKKEDAKVMALVNALSRGEVCDGIPDAIIGAVETFNRDNHIVLWSQTTKEYWRAIREAVNTSIVGELGEMDMRVFHSKVSDIGKSFRAPAAALPHTRKQNSVQEVEDDSLFPLEAEDSLRRFKQITYQGPPPSGGN